MNELERDNLYGTDVVVQAESPMVGKKEKHKMLEDYFKSKKKLRYNT